MDLVYDLGRNYFISMVGKRTICMGLGHIWWTIHVKSRWFTFEFRRFLFAGQSTTNRWPEYYESMENGHCNVSLTKEFLLPDGTTVKLGTWLENERDLRRMGRFDQTSSVGLQPLVDEGKVHWERSVDMNRR
jgi:hypothetical protein